MKTITVNGKTFHWIKNEYDFNMLWSQFKCDDREFMRLEHPFMGDNLYLYDHHRDESYIERSGSFIRQINSGEFEQLKRIYDFVAEYISKG